MKDWKSRYTNNFNYCNRIKIISDHYFHQNILKYFENLFDIRTYGEILLILKWFANLARNITIH